MQMPYVERDCVITHNGHTFESGGAVVTDQFAIAYPSANGVLADWHGNAIGTWRLVSQWPIGFGQRMAQIEATINGVRYTGRGQGVGMIWRGKAKKV